jgi:hypothetical protein
MKARNDFEVLPAQSGWYVLQQSTDTWVPSVGWRLSFDPADPSCDHPITLPVVFGAWSVDDDYVVKSPDGLIGYVHDFEIAWTVAGTEQDRISDCKVVLQNAEWAAEFEEREREAAQSNGNNKKEQRLQ